MKSKLFKRPTEKRLTENGQRKTALSRIARVMPAGAARSGGISSFKRFLAALGMTALLYWPATAQSGNGVTVDGLKLDAGTVTFNISWDKSSIPKPDGKEIVWSDTVWVFVDYNKAGRMERLPLLPGATLTFTSPGGWVKEEPNNDEGVWVVGNARQEGSFSATVQLLTATAVNSGACVYASNYPPVGVFTTADGISFTGTPAYGMTVKRKGEAITLPAGSSYSFPAGDTLLSFRDKTGAPGRIITHAVYCLYDPGAVGGAGDMKPSCAAYVAGAIGGTSDAPPSCASYAAGSIGGASDAAPSCAAYRAGSIGGLSFKSSNCEAYVAGLVVGVEGKDPSLAPGCAAYVAGAIGGEGSSLPSCASYAAGAIGGAGDLEPSCAAYRAGSIGGLSFVGSF